MNFGPYCVYVCFVFLILWSFTVLFIYHIDINLNILSLGISILLAYHVAAGELWYGLGPQAQLVDPVDPIGRSKKW